VSWWVTTNCSFYVRLTDAQGLQPHRIVYAATKQTTSKCSSC